ncbi:MAG: AI-2E family transporter [Patescibacteria group bacterium]|nr:AI-2E family transporter [Patescibacteria group bacterium]
MEISQRPININISTATILKAILIILALYFFYLVRDILIIIFISLILSSALDPWVDWMHKRKIPRGIGIILIYFVLLIIVASAFYLIIPPIISQVKELSVTFPHYLEKVISGVSALKEYAYEHGVLDNIKASLGALSSNLEGAAGGIFSTVSGIVGGIVSFFLILVMTFYMVVEESAMKKIIWSVAPAEYQPYIMQLTSRMQAKIGLWLRGQLILSLIIFTLTFLGLYILGVKYALTLAFIAGLTEFIPYLGPILASIPAIFLAFAQSPMLALFTLGLYYIIQLMENHIIVPKLMQKVVGLNPIVSIVVLLVGFQIAGVIGAILSLPVATAIGVFLKDLFEGRKAGEGKEI